MQVSKRDQTREKLAELAHDQWSGWMKYLFSKAGITGAGEYIIPNDLSTRWLRQINTPYALLSEEEKESDRKEADRVIALLNVIEPLRAYTSGCPYCNHWGPVIGCSKCLLAQLQALRKQKEHDDNVLWVVFILLVAMVLASSFLWIGRFIH